MRAPQDGWITKRNVERGDYLQVGASVFSIVTPEVWITANFKETQAPIGCAQASALRSPSMPIPRCG